MKKALWMAVALFAGSALAGDTLKGKVAEKIDGGGYTYLRISAKGGDTWAAVPKAEVKVGSEAEVLLQTEMKNFNSPTLNRTFASVWFGTLAGASAAQAAQAQKSTPAAQPQTAMGGAKPQAGEAVAAAASMTVPMSARGMTQQQPPNHPQVAQASAPAAQAKPATVRKAGAVKQVAAVFADVKKLKGQEVTVKGKVVKFTAGVMGKNWIHLQDGSGTAEKKNHDLTITTQMDTAVGQEITVTGVLLTEQDIGSGYYFDALLDDATIQR